jgi:hypothetical protein
MKVGDKVRVVGWHTSEIELQGVITELLPAGGQWGKTAIVSFPNLGEKVEYELTDLEVVAPEDTQAAVEDYVFWREAIEGVK